MPDAEKKCCSKCGEAKSLSEFGCDSKSRDGKMSYCILCNRKKVREWKKNNPGMVADSQKRRRCSNYERVREIEQKSKMRPEAIESRKEYQRTDEYRGKKKFWRVNNVELIREYMRKYMNRRYRENPEPHRARSRDYYRRLIGFDKDKYIALRSLRSIGLPVDAINEDVLTAKVLQMRVTRLTRKMAKGVRNNDRETRI